MVGYVPSVASFTFLEKAETIMSERHMIAVLEGDGIGPEIMRVALQVLEVVASKSGAVFDLQSAPFGETSLTSGGNRYRYRLT